MAELQEGNGVTYTYSGLTLAATRITIPGWDKEEIDLTTLANTAVKTATLGALKKYGKLVIETIVDLALYDAFPESNATLAITSGSESITFWAQLSNTTAVDLENDARPLYSLEFLITNLNGSGVETVPVHA